MKRILLFNFLLLTFCTLNAQVKYSQDFENGFGDMILLDLDNKTPHPDVADFAEAWTLLPTNDGNTWAVANSYYSTPAKADDWMITPIINDITDKTVLTWTAFSADGNFQDSYEVRVSTGGDKPADFTKVLLTVNEEIADLTNHNVLLKEYAGQSIRLAFRLISTDKFLLFVDNIEVKEAERLLDVSFDNGTVKKYPLINTSNTIGYTFLNEGITPVKSMVVGWTDGTNQYVDSLKNLNIGYYETYKGNFKTKFKSTTPTLYNITAKVLSVNGTTDEVPANNEKVFAIHVLNKDVPKKMVVEEATGTWCGWCPRGAVNMALMAENYPDDFIGIAVHNSDPMQNDAYNAGLTSFEGFSGFPSVIINRNIIEDPGNLEAYWLGTVRAESAAADVQVSSTIADRTITVDASVDFNTQFSNEDLKFIAVLVEDNVTGTTAKWAQTNYYAGGTTTMGGFEKLADPVPAKDMIYNEVGRALPFGYEGRSNSFEREIANGDFKDISFDIDVPSGYDINEVSVVVMVADSTGSIIGAAKTQSKAVAVVDQNDQLTGVSLAPNPASDHTYLKLNLVENTEVTVNIVNQLGQIVAQRNYGHLSGDQILPIITSDFNKGLYLVNVVAGKNFVTKKLMVD